MEILRAIGLSLVLLMPSQAVWSAPEQSYAWSGVARIVAVGDIHGAYAEFVGLLQAAQLVDEQLAWIGGRTHFVSVGDLLDRGPDSKRVMDFLIELQPQARQAGGAVHVLLGNHEIMNLTGDLRDASDAEMTSHGGRPGHQTAFALAGVYGSWLLQQPSLIQINDTLFVHGGLSSITWDGSLAALNEAVTTDLTTVLTLGAELRRQSVLADEGDLLDPGLVRDQMPIETGDELHQGVDQQLDAATAEQYQAFKAATASIALGRNSLQWYRGNAVCHPLIEGSRLERALAQLSAVRVVVGHTPTKSREVRTRFDGRVMMIDTGMLRSFYQGNPRALIIERAGQQDQLSVIDTDGALRPMAPVKTWSAQVEPTFLPLSKKQAGRALAAHELDRILGLNFTPPTTRAAKGINLGLNASLSEAARVEKQLVRPNYCEQGSAYQLLAAFDALIGKFDRGPDNLHYDRRSWNVIALDNHLAFGTSTRVPQYSVPVKLAPQLKLALEALSAEDLYTRLDKLISKREIRALLKRRDQIITWPEM